jgi:hypothetical protein
MFLLLALSRARQKGGGFERNDKLQVKTTCKLSVFPERCCQQGRKLQPFCSNESRKLAT